MINTNLLNELETIIKTINDNDMELVLQSVKRLRDKVIEEIGKKPTTDYKSNVKASALRVLKLYSGNDSCRPTLGKAQVKDNYIEICDGFRGVRFNKDTAPDLLTNEPDAAYPDLDSIYSEASKQSIVITLPTLSTLLTYITTEKAKKRANKDKTPVLYELSNNQVVNAEYLRDMLQVLPHCEAYGHSTNNYAPIYFKASTGVGILLPMRVSR